MKKTVTLASKDYVDNTKVVSIDIGGSIPDLTKYHGKALYIVNSSPITIDGIVINSWTHWYFPKYSTGDCFGFAIYPDGSKVTIIGHTSAKYYARKLL